MIVCTKSLAGELTIFAASSLQTALDKTVANYHRKHNIAARISYGASSTMARQIAHGAPADLYLSANIEWIDWLIEKGLAHRTKPMAIATNRLVLIAPETQSVMIKKLNTDELLAALGNNRLAIANPHHVPAGVYAKQALKTLGIWPVVKNKLAPTDNVRAALALVARGEAPLGIVYVSDVKAEPSVQVISSIPENTHKPIIYGAAIITGGHDDAALSFLRYLISKEGFAPFKAAGLMRP